ncbi:MAG: amidohydrolase [Armatimonadota bacterium]
MGLAPDLVLHSGKIVTVDQGFSVADAVAVYDGRFVAVGRNADVRTMAGTARRVIDLKGRCVIPGLMDNHVHFLLAGLDAPEVGAKVNIATLQSIDQILGALADRVHQTRPGQWIGTSCMYRGALREGRFPTRHDLDRVAPDRPVYIFQSGKNVIVNSHALKLAGIDRNTPDPAEPEGYIVRDENGEPTGHLIAGAADQARKRWWQHLGQPVKKWDFLYFDQETQIRAIEAQSKIYHQCGIVGVRDMGVAPDELEAYVQAESQGRLRIRTDLILGLPARYMTTAEVVDAIQRYFGPKQHLGSDLLTLGGLKMVVVNDGWWAYSLVKLHAMIATANRVGWRLNIHINTGGAGDSTEVVLTALEQADKERSIAGRRFSFEHGFGLYDPDHYERTRRLGIIIGANSLLAYYASARSFHMHQVMEQVRIAKMTESDPWKRTVRDWGLPLRSWFDAGLVVTGGSDNPAVVYDPERPLLNLYGSLTGETLVGRLLPGEELSREQTLRMFTINNAYAVFKEHVRGSIEVGKLADLVVLEDDILTCPPERLKDMKVLMTFVGGELVYDRPT